MSRDRSRGDGSIHWTLSTSGPVLARIASDPFPVGPTGNKAFVMPDAWVATAASDGVLWSAGHTPREFAVVVDHGAVATFYQHLDTLFVPETKAPAKGAPRVQLVAIKAGQPHGVIGGDPLDPARLKYLHLGCGQAGQATRSIPAAHENLAGIHAARRGAVSRCAPQRVQEARRSGARPNLRAALPVFGAPSAA